MVERHLKSNILAALSDTPVVLVNGARQAGKSTLVKEIIGTDYPARYFTLDDAGVLSAAQDDPAGFLSGLTGPIVIDEVQRAPELFLAISRVDRNRSQADSADRLGRRAAVPRLSIRLRSMEILTRWHSPRGDREPGREVLDAIFAICFGNSCIDDIGISGISALRVIYPEALSRSDPDRGMHVRLFGTILTRHP